MIHTTLDVIYTLCIAVAGASALLGGTVGYLLAERDLLVPVRKKKAKKPKPVLWQPQPWMPNHPQFPFDLTRRVGS